MGFPENYDFSKLYHHAILQIVDETVRTAVQCVRIDVKMCVPHFFFDKPAAGAAEWNCHAL